MLRRTFALVTVAFLCILTSTGAVATAQRTFVASNGNDANSCSLVSPCRAFAAAIAQTISGGEVIVLDSAGYGQVDITQSVSIIAPAGVYAGITVFSGNGVTVFAGPTDNVVLRGLTINGAGGAVGILVNTGSGVRIERCTVSNFSDTGIRIAGGSSIVIAETVSRDHGAHGIHVSGGTPELLIRDTDASNNGTSGIFQVTGVSTLNRVTAENNGFVGIWIDGSASTTRSAVRDSVFAGTRTTLGIGGWGAYVAGGVAGSQSNVAFERCTFARNQVTGLFADSQAGGIVVVTVTQSVSTENLVGFTTAGAGSTLYLSATTVTRNVLHGLVQDPGTVFITSGNNSIVGNGADIGAPVLVPLR
jgi:hypothetical protein